MTVLTHARSGERIPLLAERETADTSVTIADATTSDDAAVTSRR